MRKQDHPLYLTWANMRTRCNTPSAPNYHRYGGRGITICDRWRDFWLFVEDVGEKPSPKHTIDRIDNDGNYEPGNVRWATKKEQSLNTKRVRWVVIDGVKYRAADLAAKAGFKTPTIIKRVAQGLSMAEIIDPNPRWSGFAEGVLEKTWQNRRNKTHCKRGHEFTHENTYIPKTGGRVCRTCMRMHSQEWERLHRKGKRHPS